MVPPLISVVFTCRGRPALTELCLSRLVELMPQPYELLICYDGDDWNYIKMLAEYLDSGFIFSRGKSDSSRFSLINKALGFARGDYFMHIENDFYWVDPTCLTSAVKALQDYDVDFVRFELLPFVAKQFNRFEQVEGHDVCWMKPDTPYRFTLNPSIRDFKFPGNHLLKTSEFNKQPEQYFNDEYDGNSVCLTGDNWRHLGVFDESNHFKPYYLERFFNQRGKKETNIDELIEEFNNLTDNVKYRKLFNDYLLGGAW